MNPVCIHTCKRNTNVTGQRADAAARGQTSDINFKAITRERNDKDLIFKNHVQFTDNIIEIINAQAENAKDLDVAMRIYHLTEYSNNYSKPLGGL